MLITALAILALPLIKQKQFKSMSYTVVAIFITIFSLVIYYYSGNKAALQEWLTSGKSHYQLQMQVMQLGGIDAIIERIRQRLSKNPDDLKGWILLNKLYLGKHDYTKAGQAMDKVHELEKNK